MGAALRKAESGEEGPKDPVPRHGAVCSPPGAPKAPEALVRGVWGLG